MAVPLFFEIRDRLHALVWVHPIPSSSLSSPLLHWMVLHNDEGPVWKFVISSVKTLPSYRCIKN